MNRLAEIEVLLFVAGEDGLTLRNLAEMLEMQPTAVSQQLEKLSEKYMADKASGLAILSLPIATSWLLKRICKPFANLCQNTNQSDYVTGSFGNLINRSL